MERERSGNVMLIDRRQRKVYDASEWEKRGKHMDENHSF